KRASDFLRAFRLNKTIRSWTSSHIVNIHVVAFAAMADGLKRLQKSTRSPPSVAYEQNAGFPSKAWSKEVTARVVALCQKYAPRVEFKFKHFPLGFNNTMGMMVFGHSCPNNVPPILWSTSSNWQGIFPDRMIPPSLAGLFSQERNLEQLKEQLHQIGQKSISQSDVLHRSGLAGRRVLTTLALLRRRMKVERIANVLGLAIGECHRIIQFCREAGLLADNGHLTDQGLIELEYARRKRVEQFTKPVDNKFYFPKSLREARV
ncbi:MAG TPA: hypothetical protein VEU33_31080, partial [Archangium sp.]|nr:hypothetical protein [Archangium sp.]